MSRSPRRNSNSKNRRKPRGSGDAFWGDANYSPREADQIRPTPAPAALPHSLGDPPLTPDTAAEHHLAAVYEEAVRTATALAAANGLLQLDVQDEGEN